VVFVVGISVFVWLVVRPRGEAVGVIDVGANRPSVSFDAKVGDEILFRLDYTFDLGPAKTTVEEDDRIVQEAMEKSGLAVELTDASGVKQRTSCPAYAGKSIMSRQSGSRHSETGVMVDCKLVVTHDGAYSATGGVTFVDVRHVASTVEVRRLRAAP
jgi:hypothetical protein